MRQLRRGFDARVGEAVAPATQRVFDERGAGVFAEDPARPATDELGRNCFVHAVVDQHRLRVDAGLVCEHLGADDRLVLLQRNPADAFHEARQLAQLAILEAGKIDAVEHAQRDDELVEFHVAGALAVSVRGDGNDLEAARGRDDRVDRAEPVVVVQVRDDRQSFREGGDDARAIPARRLGRQRADRVGPSGARSTGLQPGLEVLDVAAAAVLRSELDALDAALARVANRVALQADVRRTIKVERQLEPFALVASLVAQQRLADLILQVKIAAARKDEERHLARLDPHVAQRLHGDIDVLAIAAAHHDDLHAAELAATLRVHHELQRAPVAFGCSGKADAHDVHADPGQLAGDLEFLRGSVADAGHLLAVAQRLVVDADLAGIREVDVSGELLRVPDEAIDLLAEHADAFYEARLISWLPRSRHVRRTEARPCLAERAVRASSRTPRAAFGRDRASEANNKSAKRTKR